MSGLYIIVDRGDGCHLLGLEPYTQATAARAISWQVQFGTDRTACHICRFDAATGKFVSIADASREFVPEQSPYTDSSWADFRRRLDWKS